LKIVGYTVTSNGNIVEGLHNRSEYSREFRIPRGGP